MSAGFVQRLVALIIDGFLIGLLYLPVNFVMAMAGFAAGGSDDGMMAAVLGLASMVAAAISFAISFVYYGYFWSRTGQSPGKKVMNIRVVRQDGMPLTFVSAGLRGSVGYWISSVVFLLGFIWAAFDAKQETWHDKIFGTRVEVA